MRFKATKIEQLIFITNRFVVILLWMLMDILHQLILLPSTLWCRASLSPPDQRNVNNHFCGLNETCDSKFLNTTKTGQNLLTITTKTRTLIRIVYFLISDRNKTNNKPNKYTLFFILSLSDLSRCLFRNQNNLT